MVSQVHLTGTPIFISLLQHRPASLASYTNVNQWNGTSAKAIKESKRSGSGLLASTYPFHDSFIPVKLARVLFGEEI